LTKDEGFRREIHGSKGSIVLSSTSLYIEMEKVSVKIFRLDDNENTLPVEGLSTEYDPVAGNLKRFYQNYAKAKNSEHLQPQLNNFDGATAFEDAIIRHRQIEAILESSKSGKRETCI
jgi:predicted dehydrogenase